MRLPNHSFLFLLLIIYLMLGGCMTTGKSNNVCPVLPDNHLTSLEVYDGPLVDMAILKPEQSSETQGYWNLAYVYEAGRGVNVRCYYADETHIDINLVKKVNQCRYKMLADNKVEFICD
jgi:hypothetical protein